MNGNMGELRDELRQHFSGIAATFDRANTLVFDDEHPAEQDLREQLRKIDETAEQVRAQAVATYASFERLINDERAETAAQIAAWKQARQTSQLHARADRCERCAVVATEIALLAMDQAERAIIQALLARAEAISAQIQHVGPHRP